MANPEFNRLQVFENTEGVTSRVWLPIGPDGFKPKTIKDIIRLQIIHYSPKHPKEIRIVRGDQNTINIRPGALGRLKVFIEQNNEEARRTFFDFLDKNLQSALGVEIFDSNQTIASDEDVFVGEVTIKNPDPFEKSKIIQAQAKNPNREIAIIQTSETYGMPGIETSTPYFLEQTQGKKGLRKFIRRVQGIFGTTIRIRKTE